MYIIVYSSSNGELFSSFKYCQYGGLTISQSNYSIIITLERVMKKEMRETSAQSTLIARALTAQVCILMLNF